METFAWTGVGMTALALGIARTPIRRTAIAAYAALGILSWGAFGAAWLFTTQ